MRYVGVIPKDIACGELWPQIESLVLRAEQYGRGEYTASDILQAIQAGEAFALGVVESGVVDFVLIATLIHFPRKRVLYIQAGAGKGSKIAREALVKAARTLKADWIEARCRESVARIFRGLGFDIGYQVAILETPQ